jgi:hypothetical protein
MTLGTNGWLMLVGTAAILIGILLRRWAGRYDLKEAAMDSAWTLLRGRRTAQNPTAIEAKLRDIQSQPTWTGKASSAAGTAVGHVIAQVVGVVALVLILAGLALAAVGFFWH